MSDRSRKLSRAARAVAIDIAAGRDAERLTETILYALALVDEYGRRAVPTDALGRDERTRDLEDLIGERDAARAEVERLKFAMASKSDAHDLDGRALAAALKRCEQAEAELGKARTLVDELREQLAEPTVQNAAVDAWLRLQPHVRTNVAYELRKGAADGSGPRAWIKAAEVLESLAIQTPVPSDDDRAGVPTDAADETYRMRVERDSFRDCNERQRFEIERLQKKLADVARLVRGG